MTPMKSDHNYRLITLTVITLSDFDCVTNCYRFLMAQVSISNLFKEQNLGETKSQGPLV